MNDIAIRVDKLGKRYRIGQTSNNSNGQKSFLRKVTAPFHYLASTLREPSPDEILWALREISFEVKYGEVVGIVGSNGAGKSTLLKILSRITEPTVGTADIYGRVGSLLEVGTGFHPQLTGRENIYLNGAILGMKRPEINHKFDEIVEFAGIERFIDTQVKRYSSGMRVRLAFSVAAHLDPEIMIIDEVLAVGDAAFQQKCLTKMHGIANEGRTILFVSHNMASVEALCDRGFVLNNGKMQFMGSTQETINVYLSNFEQNIDRDLSKRFEDSDPLGEAWYTSVDIGSGTILSGDPLDIKLTYQARTPGLRLNFAIGLYNTKGVPIAHLGTRYATQLVDRLPASGEYVCHIPRLPLPEGRYRINLSLWNMNERVDRVTGAAILEVQPGDFYGTGKIPPSKSGLVLLDFSSRVPESV